MDTEALRVMRYMAIEKERLIDSLDGTKEMEDQILEALKELVDELDKQSDKLPRDNDRIWDRLYIAKMLLKKQKSNYKNDKEPITVV